MSSDFKRTDRIAETMLRELAQIIRQEITDPRLSKFVTLSAVKVTRDLGHAKVYFTVLDADPVQTALILNTAANYLRTILAKSMTLRIVPQLHFIYDESIEYAKRLTRLIDEANSPEQDEEPS